MAVSLSDVATRTGLSESAIRALHDALVRGRGAQAQFNQPELGGMGQWMRGGMVMIGDMFNTELAAKVSHACALLSEDPEVARASLQQSWWPTDCGDPSMCASQDDVDYAYFPNSQRLAVRRAGKVVWFDVSGAEVQGVGARSGTITVQTSKGPRPLSEFRRIDDPVRAPPAAT